MILGTTGLLHLYEVLNKFFFCPSNILEWSILSCAADYFIIIIYVIPCFALFVFWLAPHKPLTLGNMGRFLKQSFEAQQ